MDFKTLCLEGWFGPDRCDTLSGSVSIAEALQAFVGSHVRLAIHHVPPDGFISASSGWGYGSCSWQDKGVCPAGHHEHPHKLLTVAGEGVLHHENGRWWLASFSGQDVELPIQLMDGHHGRIVGATVPDLEKMRESLVTKFDPSQVEALGIQAEQLKSLLTQMKQRADQ